MQNDPQIDTNISVLYVEDTISAQQEFSEILSMLVDEVIVASDGQEGLDKYKEYSPDIIITDIQMPIMTGLQMIEKIRQTDKDTPIMITSAFNDNSYLFKSIELGIEYYLLKPVILDKLQAQIEKITNVILQKRELNSYHEFLEEKIQEEMALREAKESLLLQQNKSSEIGNMVGIIAHQWKQPLNYINSLIEDIGLEFEYQPLTKEYIDDLIKKGTSRVDFLTTTMDNFLKFYKSENLNKKFKASEVVNEIKSFLDVPYKALGINIEIDAKKDFELLGVENEFQQIVLNLITNAKEAFRDLNSTDSKIIVNIDIVDGNGVLKVIDNATGIDKDKIDKIFNLEYTTKQDGNGIGLYLVKKLVTHRFKGSIEAINVDKGACFTLSFKIGDSNE